jgi:hypothetical protein
VDLTSTHETLRRLPNPFKSSDGFWDIRMNDRSVTKCLRHSSSTGSLLHGWFWSSLALSLLFLTGCGPYHIHNKPPVLNSTPEPDVRPEQSYIPIQVSVDASPLKNILTQQIPSHFDESGNPNADKLRWSFDRSSGPNVSFSEGKLLVDASYNGDVETRGAFGGCHLKPVYPKITVSTIPRVYQDGTNWVFGPKETRIHGELLAGSDTACSIIRLPAEDRILNFLNGDTVTNQVFKALDKAKFSIPLATAIKAMDGPFVIKTTYEYILGEDIRFCFYPQPSVVAFSDFSGSLSDIRATVVVRASPLFSMPVAPGKQCPSYTRKPEDTVFLAALPPNMPTVADLKHSLLIDTKELSLLLYYKIPAEVNFQGHRISVKDTEISGASGRMILRIGVTGYVNGNVYFWGTPRVNSDGSAIEVPDVQLSAESTHLLDAIKFGLADLFSKTFIDSLKKNARLDFKHFYEEPQPENLFEMLKRQMTRTVSSGPVTLDIKTTDVKAEMVWMKLLPDHSSAFLVVFDMKGTINGQVRPFAQ